MSETIAPTNEGGHVAYFTMEIGLESEMKTYSGGLGVLAGDTVRSYADLDVPAVAVTQLNDLGYCKQELGDDGSQISSPDEWDVSEYLDPLDVEASVHIDGRDVTVTAWEYTVESPQGGTVPVVFLDTNVEDNDDRAREITRRLYGPGTGPRRRVAQELVLGVGGVRVLDELGYQVDTYHLNEGHASFLTLELLKRHEMDPEPVREQCAFTTHTPVPGGHDEFDYGLVGEMMGEYVPVETLQEYGGEEQLHMTKLALNLSHYANAVAKKHEKVSREMFPGYEIDSITNGVHLPTWVSDSFRDLFDEYTPGWRTDPYKLRHATLIPEDEIWEAHQEEKAEFCEYVEDRTGVEMDPEVLTIGFARRAATYKRMNLLFRDISRLRYLASEVGDLQFVFAGKAYPGDVGGEDLIREVFHQAEELSDVMTIVYLEDYDMNMGARLTSGVDVWLNNPRRPYEACGTSGMKCAYNGIPQLSTLDGWWLEGHIEGVTGWKIGPRPGKSWLEDMDPDEEDHLDVHDMYNQLENEVIPTYYQNRDEWGKIMRNAIAFNGPYYHTGRMVGEYLQDAYDR